MITVSFYFVAIFLGFIINILSWILIIKRNKYWYCYLGLITSIISFLTMLRPIVFAYILTSIKLSSATEIILRQIDTFNTILSFISFFILAIIIYKNKIQFKIAT